MIHVKFYRELLSGWCKLHQLAPCLVSITRDAFRRKFQQDNRTTLHTGQEKVSEMNLTAVRTPQSRLHLNK